MGWENMLIENIDNAVNVVIVVIVVVDDFDFEGISADEEEIDVDRFG